MPLMLCEVVNRMETDWMIFVLLLVFLIAAPSIAIFVFKNNAGAGVLAAAGAAALLLTRLPDISNFELLGLKAKLERQSKQVEVSLQQLQKLAAALARANLAQIGMSGQLLAGLGTETKFQFHDQIISSLRDLHLSEEDIHDAQDVWIEVYGRMLLATISAHLEQRHKGAADAIAKLSKYPKTGLASPDAVNRYAASTQPAPDETLKELLKNYKSLIETGSMEKPELIPFNQQLPTNN